MELGRSRSVARRGHIQAFTFLFDCAGTLKIMVGCLMCGVVCGLLCFVCVHVARVLWWCVCVVCGEAWHALSLSLSLSCSLSFLPLLFPFLFPFLFLSSLSFSLFFFFSSCSFSCSCSCSCSCSSFFFECDLAHGSLTRKKGGNFLLQEYSRRGNYFYYSLKLIQKSRRRVKLQSLQFYLNSKTIGL